MNKAAIYHESESSLAFPLDERHLVFRLRAAKDDLKEVTLIWVLKFQQNKGIFNKVKMHLGGSTLEHDYFETILESDDTRIQYLFEVEDYKGEKLYYSESGFEEYICFEDNAFDSFQYGYNNPSDMIRVNKKFANRVFYQIFPDRFARDESVKAIREIKWDSTPSMWNFCGGNIKGITGKLDYLKDLGIRGIYLNPVFKGDTNHKYDTTEYGVVDPDFGTDEDLIELVKKAHEKDILVVLDLVFNHTSFRHPFFQDCLKRGRKSPYYNFYMIDGDYPDFKKGNYRSFGMHHYMPKINLNHEDAKAYFIKVALDIRKKFNIDGYRLDVGDEVAHTFWRELHIALKKEDHDFMLIGEIWHNAEVFLNKGDEFQSVMNYAITREVQNFFALKNIDASTFVKRMSRVFYRYKDPINLNLLNLLSSHDKTRFLDDCHFNVASYLSGYLFTFFYLGIPSLYYGDEVGLDGRDNILCRKCFPWEEERQNKVILETMKAMLKIRNRYDLTQGDFSLTSLNDLLIMSYKFKSEELQIIFNQSGENKEVTTLSPLLALNYESGVLKAPGFIITSKTI